MSYFPAINNCNYHTNMYSSHSWTNTNKTEHNSYAYVFAYIYIHRLARLSGYTLYWSISSNPSWVSKICHLSFVFLQSFRQAILKSIPANKMHFATYLFTPTLFIEITVLEKLFLFVLESYIVSSLIAFHAQGFLFNDLRLPS